MNAFLRNMHIFLQNVGWKDVLDVVIVAVLIYQLLKLLRGSQAFQILLGLMVVFVVGLLAEVLQLRLLEFLYSNGLQAILLAVIILFQPELRRALDQIGRFGGIRRMHIANKEALAAVDGLIKAIDLLQQQKWGALIVLEQHTRIDSVIASGVAIDARITSEMLTTIFYPGSTLHDGAVVLRDGRLWAAGCVLPLADRSAASEKRRFGTRHRAALGLSQVSDALIVIVSEESGTVSLACDTRLTVNVDTATLKAEIYRAFGLEEKSALHPPQRTSVQPQSEDAPIAEHMEHEHVAP